MTKILYIAPISTRKFMTTLGEDKEYNMEKISQIIIEDLTNNIDNISIEMINNVYEKNNFNIDKEVLEKYDIFLCDISGLNPNITYIAGQVKALEKPIFYIKANDIMQTVDFIHSNFISYSDSSIKKEFSNTLIKEIKSAIKNPESYQKQANKTNTEPKAFISYSHKDKQYLDRLNVHLKPLIDKGLIHVWDDTQIKTGDMWQIQIKQALEESNIAILLISADFMASDFIINNELPPLLSNAEVKGTKILPVIISHCRFDREKTLSRFQAINSPNSPLSSLKENEREEIYDKLAYDIEKAIN